MIGLYRIAAILVVIAAVAAAIYVKGRNDGRVEQLRDSVEAFVKRGKIDNETNALDRSALCVRLGGLPDDCDELRGMGETTSGQ